MKARDRIKSFLRYAGRDGASGADIGAICNIWSARLYPVLLAMEQAGELISKFGVAPDKDQPRRRYYRLSEFE